MASTYHGRFNLSEVNRFKTKYIIGETLVARGTNSVASGTHKKTNHDVIIKATFTQEANSKLKEANILRKLANVPGVVDMLDHFHTHPKVHILVFEKSGNQSLRRYLREFGALTQNQARLLIKQIVTTVDLCLQLNIIHTQLKSSNLVLNAQLWEIKMTNFNAATYINPDGYDAKKRRLCTSVSPPEYFTRKHFTSDGLSVWSIGCLLYELLFNVEPFKGVHEILNKNCFNRQQKKTISLKTQLFVEWCLEKNSIDRMTLKQMLNHHWITKR